MGPVHDNRRTRTPYTWLSIPYEPRSSLSCERHQEMLRVADHDLFSAVPQKRDRRFNFRFHAAFKKMALFQLALGFAHAHFINGLSIRALIVQVHMFDIRADQQCLEVQFVRQQG